MKILMKLIELCAYSGARAASAIFAYQPKLPKALQ